MEQKIRFCTAPDGVRIAYATVGQGPPLVKAPNWLNHLEFEWQSPMWRHWWEELAKDHQLVRFDQRGCGLSDWSVQDQSFAAWVSDMESVVAATGLDRFVLLGISQGGAAAVEYAVRHPERVSHLVLYGAFARGWAKRGLELEERMAIVTLTRQGWGRDNPAYRQLFTSQFMPEASLEQMHWFNELQRISTSPENAARIQMETGKVDVLDRLPHVAAPTLVLHARNDGRVPFQEGRQLGALIPNARFVPLESNNHLLLESEPAWQSLLSEVHRFLGPEEAGGLGELLGRLTRANPDGLTERELEVVRLITLGKRNREIAQELVISPSTVVHHVSNILAKTGATNRAGVATYAARHGLVSL